MRKRWRWTVGLLLCAHLYSGCAVFEKENRRLLNRLDEKIKPDSIGERIAWAPLAVPAATLALAADAAVIHPACSIPKAWDDTRELLWKTREDDLLRRSVFFMPCVALTPPTFAGAWAVRSVFPVDNN